MDNHPIAETPDHDDEIDRFASRLLKHPDRAEVLKRDIRARIGLEQHRPERAHTADADLDDLWDNVPV